VLRGVILDRLATGDVRTDQALKRSVQLVESRAYQVDAGGIIQTGLGGLPRLLQQRPRASFPPLARAAGSNGHDEGNGMDAPERSRPGASTPCEDSYMSAMTTT